jgi:hypothetical protein
MPQEQGPRHLLGVRFTYSEPSRMNGADDEARNNLVGMFFVNCEDLRGAREIALIAGARMETVLTTLLEAVEVATQQFNKQNPLPEEKPAEAQEEEIDLQA